VFNGLLAFDPWRRHLIGRRLLRKAEEEAVTRGCLDVYLDTFDFQARGFYEKEGYEILGVPDGYPLKAIVDACCARKYHREQRRDPERDAGLPLVRVRLLAVNPGRILLAIC
jgi:ribosomal protein S18 acetylase RimI-like enzyme